MTKQTTIVVIGALRVNSKTDEICIQVVTFLSLSLFFFFFLSLFIAHHTVLAGHYGFTLDACVSAHLWYVCRYFHFRTFTLVNVNGFCPSVIRLSVFLCQDVNLSKCPWIFIKLGMCIAIVQI